MSESESKFDVPVESISDAPGFTMRFSGDTVRAELAGAKLYAEAEGDDRTRMRLTDSSGEVLADITLHPRSHRNATENVIDVASALLWSHWRYTQSQAKASVTAALVDTPSEADAMTVPVPEGSAWDGPPMVRGLDGVHRPMVLGHDGIYRPGQEANVENCPSNECQIRRMCTSPSACRTLGPNPSDDAPAPLSLGSTWTGQDGTVYDVVRPEEVGNRRRWWIWGAETARPEDSEELHWDALDEISGGPPNCALVIRHLPDRLRASLRSLLGLPADIDDEAVIEGVKRFGEQWKALRDQELERLIAAEDALAETREKLAASDLAKRSADRRLEKLQRLESERDAKPAKDKVPTAVMRGLRLICTAGAVEDAGINNGSDTHEDIVAARDWLAVRKKPPAKAKRKGGR